MTDFEMSGTSGVVIVPSPSPTRQGSRLQKRLYLFLEWPSPILSLAYHMFLCIWCLLLVCLGIASEERKLASMERMGTSLAAMEIFTNIWLIADFVLRLWSSGCRTCFRGIFGKLWFCVQFLSIIDVISIILGVLAIIGGVREYDSGDVGFVIIDNEHDYNYNADDYYDPAEKVKIAADMGGLTRHAKDILLFVQILRLFKFARLFAGAGIILSVMKQHRKLLLAILHVGVIGLLMFAYLLYKCENHGEYAQNIPYSEAVYWALITLTTVGYGDIYAKSPAGRAFACLTAAFGVATFFMPAVLIAVGSVRKLEENRILRKRSKGPAAALIQAQWRMSRRMGSNIGGPDVHGVGRAIMIMKLLAARKNFQNTRQSEGKDLPLKTLEASHELTCALESRMILMEKSMTSVQAKLDHLLKRSGN